MSFSSNTNSFELIHPSQGASFRYDKTQHTLCVENMMLYDDTLVLLLEKLESKISNILHETHDIPFNCFFYQIPYLDNSVISALANILQIWQSQLSSSNLNVCWFYTDSSELETGEALSENATIPFQYCDLEKNSRFEALIEIFNNKTANCGLYFKMEYAPFNNQVCVIASQHPMFTYFDFKLYFEDVIYTNLGDNETWSDDYNIQLNIPASSDVLKRSAQLGFIIFPGYTLFKWNISPINEQNGLIFCRNLRIESKWL